MEQRTSDIPIHTLKANPMQNTSSKKEIQDNLIAARAYEKWQERGCPMWEDALDWSAARAELDQELETDTALPARERASSTEPRQKNGLEAHG